MVDMWNCVQLSRMAKFMIQNKELYNYIINSIKEISNDMEILKNRFNQIQNALTLAKTDEEYYEWVEKNCPDVEEGLKWIELCEKGE